MNRFFKTTAFAAATLTLASAATISTSTEAEARWHRGWRGGAIAAGVVGALALGALAASGPSYAAPVVSDPGYGGCYKVRRAMWSDYHGAYVTRRVTVCD